jgi:hypothetical protein
MRRLALVAAVALASVGGAAATEPLDGIYHVTVSAADLLRAGSDANDAKWGVGSWTLTLAGSRWTLRQTGGLYGNATVHGVVDAKGGFTTALVDGYGHHEFLGVLRGRLTSMGLVFARIEAARNTDLAAVLSARPWVRAGGGRNAIVVRVTGASTARSTNACFLLIRQGPLTYCLKSFIGYPGPNAVVRDQGLMTFALTGGTVRAQVSIVQRFAADGRHARQTLEGRLAGGTGRYRNARGTVSGGGTVVESPPTHIASSSLRYVLTLR